MMIDDQYHALIKDALRLIGEHSDILPDEARFAQARQGQRLQAILAADGEPVEGSTHRCLSGPAGIAFLSGLVDCLARLRRAAEDRGVLHPAVPELKRRQAALIRARDFAITRQLARGRPRRPRKDKPWFPS